MADTVVDRRAGLVRITRRLTRLRIPLLAVIAVVGLTAQSCPPSAPQPPTYFAARAAGKKGATALGDGGGPLNAGFTDPRDVVPFASGYYIADFGAHRIRKAAGGLISTYAGTGVSGYSGDGGPATAAKFRSPVAIDVDDAGNLFIVDYADFRVRRVGTNGIVTTVAGIGKKGYTGDGGPATNAAMYPWDIAVDEKGGFYIVDDFGYVVRYVSPAGVITTVAGGASTGNGPTDGGLAVQQDFMGEIRAVAYEKATGLLFIGTRSAVYVMDTDWTPAATRTVHRYAGMWNSPGYPIDGAAPRDTRLFDITGLAVDQTGALFIVDRGGIGVYENSSVLRVKDGAIWRVAGMGSGGKPNAEPALVDGTPPVAIGNARSYFLGSLSGIGAARDTSASGFWLPVKTYDPSGVPDVRVDFICRTAIGVVCPQTTR